MRATKDECGCKSNEREYTELCPEHAAFNAYARRAVSLDSFYGLCQYWEAHPTNENLRCIVARIRSHSHLLSDARLSAWIVAHKADLLRVRK